LLPNQQLPGQKGESQNTTKVQALLDAIGIALIGADPCPLKPDATDDQDCRVHPQQPGFRHRFPVREHHPFDVNNDKQCENNRDEAEEHPEAELRRRQGELDSLMTVVDGGLFRSPGLFSQLRE